MKASTPHSIIIETLISCQKDSIKQQTGAELRGLFIGTFEAPILHKNRFNKLSQESLLGILSDFYLDADAALINRLRDSIIGCDIREVKNALKWGADLSAHSEAMLSLARGNDEIKSLLQKQIEANDALQSSWRNDYIGTISIINAIVAGAQATIKLYGNTVNECHLASRVINTYFAIKSNTEYHYTYVINAIAALQPATIEESSVHKQRMEFLIKVGADVLAKDYFGAEPIHGAVLSGNVAAVEYLISVKADPFAQDNYGNKIIHYARSLDVLKFCLAKGCKVSDANVDGLHPLHCIAYSGRSLDIVKYLVAEQADIFATTKLGLTPLECAFRAQNPKLEVLAFLTQKLLERVPMKKIIELDSELRGSDNASAQEKLLEQPTSEPSVTPDLEQPQPPSLAGDDYEWQDW